MGYDEIVDPAIGQVWEVQWDSGDVLHPGVRGRRGVLLGMNIEHGGPTKLWFSCPMLKGRKTNEVHIRDWPPPHSKFIGLIQMTPADQLGPGGIMD